MSAPRAIALCQCFYGALEFQAGRWDEAETALRESIRLYREIGAASGEALACQRLGVLLTARRRFDEGLKQLQEGVVAAEHALMRAHCLTRLYAAMARNRLEAGDREAARQSLELGLAMSARHGNCTTCNALLLPIAVSVSLAAGDISAAATFAANLQSEAASYGSRTWVAMAHQAQGELAAARGDLTVALDHYEAAIAGFQASHYDYEAGRSLAAAAALHRQLGEEAAAQEARSHADEIFDRLGRPAPG